MAGLVCRYQINMMVFLTMYVFQFENLSDYLNGSLENDAFVKLKKMAINYATIQQEINDIDLDDDAMRFAKLELRKESIEKLSMVIENRELYNQYQSNRRRKKQEDREFELSRGCSIDRQAVFVWTGGPSFSNLENYISNCKKSIPFENVIILDFSDVSIIQVALKPLISAVHCH